MQLPLRVLARDVSLALKIRPALDFVLIVLRAILPLLRMSHLCFLVTKRSFGQVGGHVLLEFREGQLFDELASLPVVYFVDRVEAS